MKTPINERPITEESKKVLIQADELWERSARIRYELSYQFARQYRKTLEPMLNNSTVREEELDLVVEHLIEVITNTDEKPSDTFSGENNVTGINS